LQNSEFIEVHQGFPRVGACFLEHSWWRNWRTVRLISFCLRSH